MVDITIAQSPAFSKASADDLRHVFLIFSTFNNYHFYLVGTYVYADNSFRTHS